MMLALYVRQREVPMRRSVRKALSFVTCLMLLLSGPISGYAGPPPPDWMDVEGFRGLPWGVTKDAAQTVFPDLAFVRYAITGDTEKPSVVYERRNEDRRIDGIRVDEILYWFRNDSFYKVTATLGSKVGPRTMETPAAEAFDGLWDTISRVAGAPIDNRAHRGAWYGNRKGVWHHGAVSVSLSNIEPPGVNGEALVLEIVTRGK
jgi:hypothetical protein